MLKRLWVALSGLWTLGILLLFLGSSGENPKWFTAMTLEIALPWVGGLLVMELWRYTVYGTFGAPPFFRDERSRYGR